MNFLLTLVRVSLLLLLLVRSSTVASPSRSYSFQLGQVQELDSCVELTLSLDLINIPFYINNVDEARFRAQAAKVGLAGAEDLEFLYPHLNQLRPDLFPFSGVQRATGILYDVGAGYGRVKEFFDQRHLRYHWRLFEPVPRFAEELKEKYAGEASTEVRKESFLSSRIRRKADVIFMLWAVFCEFGPHEQKHVLEKAKRLLSPGGVIVLDIPSWVPGGMGPAAQRVHSGYLGVEEIPEGQIVRHRVESDEWTGLIPRITALRELIGGLGLSMHAELHFQRGGYPPRRLLLIKSR